MKKGIANIEGEVANESSQDQPISTDLDDTSPLIDSITYNESSFHDYANISLMEGLSEPHEPGMSFNIHFSDGPYEIPPHTASISSALQNLLAETMA